MILLFLLQAGPVVVYKHPNLFAHRPSKIVSMWSHFFQFAVESPFAFEVTDWQSKGFSPVAVAADQVIEEDRI